MWKRLLQLLILCSITSPAFCNDKLTVLLDWFINPAHAPLIVAESQGYFKEEHLDVELIGPADPADPPKLVAANKADIAITYEPQLIEQIDHGLPLLRIGSLIDRPLNCLAVLADSHIDRIEQLKGKQIGQSNGSLSALTLKTMLQYHHLTIDDVTIINVHYDLSQALLAKRVDAVTGLMRTYEVIQMRIAKHPVRIFLPEENGMPPYEELIYVVNKQHATDPRFPRFLSAVRKGYDYLIQHPEETWQQFAKTHPLANNELNHRAWLATLPYFAKNPVSFDAKAWQRFVEFMAQNHLIQHAQPLNVYAQPVTNAASPA